jgi:hypothetical protein
LVGTLPEYRRRGLVRALFAAVHERSAALGHQLLGITGIPYFYRQFGYTMAIDLGIHASFPLYLLPEPKADKQPKFTLRPATVEDIGDLSAWYETMARGRLLTELRSAEQWHYELTGRRPGSLHARAYLVIVNAEGEGVGYIELIATRFHPQIHLCHSYVVGDQSSYVETFDDVMAAVKQWTKATYGESQALLLFFPGIHESLEYLVERTLGGMVRRPPEKWYLRVPDPVAFLRHIQPVLERRLVGSGANRYSGELKVGFYDRTGLYLKFERGRIIEVAALEGDQDYTISFPYEFFWNMVFGDLSLEEIHTAIPDVWTGGKRAVLLKALFPKKGSWLWGLA